MAAPVAEEGLGGLADHYRPGRPVADLVLTGQKRDQLTRWVRRAKAGSALRAAEVRRLVLRACPAGPSSAEDRAPAEC